MKKANLGIETFFYILMVIMMVTIIIFGYNKFTGVNDQLTEQERLDIKNELFDTLTYCTNPLNKGSTRTVKLNSAKLNGVCFANEDTSNYPILEAVYEGGSNVILIKGDDSNGEVINIQVIDSFNFEQDFETSCQLNKITIKC